MTPDRSESEREHEHEHEHPVVRDKRRVNADGSVREPGPSWAPAASMPTAPAGAPLADTTSAAASALEAQVTELTDTLQRVKAEYDNYRRRTEKEKQLAGEMATAQVLSLLLPMLDDVERARSHGDLTGAFAAVGDALTTLALKLGLEQYGESGDVFDPQIHDAVMTVAPIVGAEVTVVADAFRRGYRFGGRVLRPAQVAVADPAAPEAAAGGEGPSGTASTSPDADSREQVHPADTPDPTAGGEHTSDPAVQA